LGLVALHQEQSAQTGCAAAASPEVGAFGDSAAERPAKRKPPDLATVVDFEQIEGRVANLEPVRSGLRARRFVAKRLEQPSNTPAAIGGAEQDRYAKAFAGFPRKVLKDPALVRNLVHQQLLEQLVIMIGQLFQHLVARFMLALLDIAGDVDLLGILAGQIMESAFQREIDEAGDPVAVADRDLPCDQRRHAGRLERGEEVADSSARLVDPVDEDDVWDPKLVEGP
jgi:hypothetical protein